MMKKAMMIGLIGAYVFLSSAFASADSGYPWCHVFLRSTSQTDIKIDYQILFEAGGRRGYAAVAKPWIHVSNSHFKWTADVSVVIQTDNINFGRTDQQIFKLSYEGGNSFGNEVPNSIVIKNGGGEKTPTRYFVLSVVIDGDWQTDPISGTHEFTLNLDENPGQCE